jgi:parvulin-like peptidyl-prolyl isomerase
MFEMLRKLIFPIIITVLVFFVAMIVLQWGLGFSGRNRNVQADIAGVVNGEEVSWQAYYQAVNNLYQNERGSRGTDYEIPDDRARQLEEQAWDELVADRLIMQQGKRLNITVTGNDIYDYLKRYPPAFLRQAPELQTDGQFDYQKYLALMVDPQAAGFWAGIEPSVREDLKRIRVQQEVIEAAHVTEEEVRQAFIDRFEKVTLGVVNTQTTRFSNLVPDPSDDELRAYFEENLDKYPVGERVTLDIVKIAKEPSQFDQEAAERQAREIYDSVTSGSDFEEFARVYSDDPGSAAQGGDLGWFAAGRMVKEFDSAAFAMKEGEISAPIKTPFGWHIIKHLGYRVEVDQREAHCMHILIKPEASPQTLDADWQKLENVRTATSEVSFAEAAEAEGLQIHSNPPVERKGYVTYIGAGEQVLDWAFRAKVGEVSEVLDLPGNFSVLQVTDRLPAGTASFDDIKMAVKRDFRNERMAKICRDTVQMVYDEIGRGRSLEDAARMFGLEYEKLNPASRDATLPRLGSDPKLIGTAFGLKVGAVSKPLDYAAGTVIFEVLDHQTADLTAFNEKRDSVFNAVLQTKQQKAYSNWYTSLIEGADVESNINFQRRR